MSIFGIGKPTITATVSRGKDKRWHIAFRDEDGNLVAESPPRGFPSTHAADAIANYFEDARIEVIIKEG